MPPVAAAIGAIGSALAPAAGAIGAGLGSVGGGLASGAGALGSALGTSAGMAGSAIGSGAGSLMSALSPPTGQYVASKGLEAYQADQAKKQAQSQQDAMTNAQRQAQSVGMMYQPQQNKLAELLSMSSPYASPQMPMQQDYYQLPVNHTGGMYG